MKAASAGFISMLNTSKFLVKADLYKLTLQAGANNGQVLYYTSAQQDITYGGHTYKAHNIGSQTIPSFSRDVCEISLGATDKSIEVQLHFDSNTRILGQTPGAFAHAGGFDNCLVEIDKFLAPSWTTLTNNGLVNLWTGICADNVDIDDGVVKLTVSAMTRLLNGAFPRNYFLTHCNHALFDSGCTLNPASFVVAGTVSNTGGAPTINGFNSNLTNADGYFSLGYITWTSGVNNGLTMAIKSSLNANGHMTLIYPFTQVPSAGDTFNAYPGCDKTENTCSTKFSNLPHFRGYPFVPTPETIAAGAGTGTQPTDTSGGGAGGGGQNGGGGPGGGTIAQQ